MLKDGERYSIMELIKAGNKEGLCYKVTKEESDVSGPMVSTMTEHQELNHFV